VRIGGSEGVGIYGGSETVPSAPQFLDESDAAGGSRGVFEKDDGRSLAWGVGVGGRQVRLTP
jgi:hypothetical protein